MMRRICLFLVLTAFCHLLSAQNVTNRVTTYQDFKSAIVLLANGNALKVGKANIFLKNSSLVYKSGAKVLQANMNNVSEVKFDDRHYVKIDSVMAYRVDTIGENGLYCATVIDMEAYNMQIANKRQITNLEISSQVSLTALVSPEDEQEYPLNDYYYFEYNGKFVRAMELYVLRSVPKAKRRLFWAIVREPGFSWTNKDSLMRLLQTIS